MRSGSIIVNSFRKITVLELHVQISLRIGFLFFIVFENEIPLRFAVISIFNCYVFQYRHERFLWNCLHIVRL